MDQFKSVLRSGAQSQFRCLQDLHPPSWTVVLTNVTTVILVLVLQLLILSALNAARQGA